MMIAVLMKLIYQQIRLRSIISIAVSALLAAGIQIALTASKHPFLG